VADARDVADGHKAEAPALILPYALVAQERDRVPVGWVWAVLVALATGLLASAVTSLGAGLIVAVVVAGGILVPWTRVFAMLGAVGFLVAGCVDVIAGQAINHYLPGSNWAGSFVHAGNLIWFGVVLLLADAVVVSARRWSRAKPPPEPALPTTAEPSLPT
jgi:hypothetical protein